MEDETLILLVQSYRELYDVSNKNYHNHQRRDSIWEEISKEIGYSVDECRRKWAALRDCYRKAQKSRRIKSGQAATSIKPWRLEKQMKFLKDFITDRRQTSNTCSQEDGGSEEVEEDPAKGRSPNSEILSNPNSPSVSNPSSSAVPKRPTQGYRPAGEVLQDYNEHKKIKKDTKNEGDYLHKYFLAAEDTVRTFPVQLQIEIKQKFSQLLHEYELKAFMLSQESLSVVHSTLPPHHNQLQYSQFDQSDTSLTPIQYDYLKEESDD
ncbi:transcription factor Adf-1-like [Sitophilus oryzae]|uniref:Transcription factor Adf-1-like n=1 Tax=Sitophilus oryzae TaxID=7048 RepID=A0A6J2YX87_SITOR|nr:transcription factor Adf-1-like [Sitophilus oryzae]